MSKVVNGVNLEALGGFVDAVKTGAVSPEIRFTAKSRWAGGVRTEVTIDQFSAGGVHAAPPERSFKLVVDEPAVLGGQDSGPNPIEYLAAGLCGCITAGIVTNAAMFGTQVEGIEVVVDLRSTLAHQSLDLGDTVAAALASALHQTVARQVGGEEPAYGDDNFQIRRIQWG
jgi:uncharacterized OsmC-like protein